MSSAGRVLENRETMLGLLGFIERNSVVTQRKLSAEVGIALGLVNAYLKDFSCKGLVRIREVSPKHYVYDLTPVGLAAKSRLTAEGLLSPLEFFREVRRQFTELLRDCANQGWRRVGLYGAGELAEIALLSVAESEVDVVCIIDRKSAGRLYAGLPIVPDLAEACGRASPHELDGIIFTEAGNPQASFDEFSAIASENGFALSRIKVPPVLDICRSCGLV